MITLVFITPSEPTCALFLSLSLIEDRNSRPGRTSCPQSSAFTSPPCISISSAWRRLAVSQSLTPAVCVYSTRMFSTGSNPHGVLLREQNTLALQLVLLVVSAFARSPRCPMAPRALTAHSQHVRIGILRGVPTTAAVTATSVQAVEENILCWGAPKRPQNEFSDASCEANVRFAQQSFRCSLTWRNNEKMDSLSADSPLHTPPFPSPPVTELNNTIAHQTIRNNTNLFHIEMPWRVDIFERLLTMHPN
jgi:hypothetical protein